jgi:hypothetical protein
MFIAILLQFCVYLGIAVTVVALPPQWQSPGSLVPAAAPIEAIGAINPKAGRAVTNHHLSCPTAGK